MFANSLLMRFTSASLLLPEDDKDTNMCDSAWQPQ